MNNITVTISQPRQQEPALGSFREEDVASRDTLEVFGFKNNEPEDTIRLFFENRSSSGGGPVKDIVLSQDQESAVVTFDDPEGNAHTLFDFSKLGRLSYVF